MQNDVKAIFFDLGGTLFSYREVIRATMPILAEAATRLQVEAQPADLGRAFGIASKRSGETFGTRPYFLHRDYFLDAYRHFARELGGEASEISSVIPSSDVSVTPTPGPTAAAPGGSTKRLPLGTIYGARSGDKGGNANLGVFARSDEAWAFLDGFLTSERLKELLPETAELKVDRYALPAIRSLNFVLHGLLGEGVAASTRQDGQAKSLGEWLRARVVDLPEALLP
jgi:hypothetical protein